MAIVLFKRGQSCEEKHPRGVVVGLWATQGKCGDKDWTVTCEQADQMSGRGQREDMALPTKAHPRTQSSPETGRRLSILTSLHTRAQHILMHTHERDRRMDRYRQTDRQDRQITQKLSPGKTKHVASQEHLLPGNNSPGNTGPLKVHCFPTSAPG